MAKKKVKKTRRTSDPDHKFLKALGKRIVKLREDKNISQNQLAKNINSYNTSLRRIENGETNATIDVLKKIADALEVSISELLNIKA